MNNTITVILTSIATAISLIALFFSLKAELRQRHRFKIELKYIDKSSESFIFKLYVYNKSVNQFTIKEIKINGYKAQVMQVPQSSLVVNPNGTNALCIFCQTFNDSIPFEVEVFSSIKSEKNKYPAVAKLEKTDYYD